jgi:hypothetical protein
MTATITMIGTTPIPEACEATKANSVTIFTLLAGFSRGV